MVILYLCLMRQKFVIPKSKNPAHIHKTETTIQMLLMLHNYHRTYLSKTSNHTYHNIEVNWLCPDCKNNSQNHTPDGNEQTMLCMHLPLKQMNLAIAFPQNPHPPLISVFKVFNDKDYIIPKFSRGLKFGYLNSNIA